MKHSIILLGLALLLAACRSAPAAQLAAPTDAPPTAAPATEPAAAAPTGAMTPETRPAVLRDVTLALPYIPNVQFSAYYVAQAKGYFAEEGLNVLFDYNFETDVVQRVAANNVQFAMASGNSVLLARANGLPIKLVATIYQRFPVVLFSKQAANITKPDDLRGKSIGIPGRFGSSYVGLQALLFASNMQESDINLQEIGFTQVAAVSEDKVQVSLGYAMNEPVVLAQQGMPVNSITIADYFPLASDGIIASEKLMAEEPQVVEGFVRAAMRGLRDTLADPDAAFQTSLEFIPEAKSGDIALQRKVLQESLPFWATSTTDQNGLGYTDLAAWQETYRFLREVNLLSTDLTVEDGFTNQFIRKDLP